MADESSDQPRRESPVADRLSHEGLESAFRTLGNETRLEVLSAILDADGRFASFSEIQDGISTDDSGNLVYHLDELTGRFVEHEDGAGYSLLPPAYHALAVVHMGTLAEDTRQISALIDEECPLCGELLRFTYEDDHRGSVSCEGCSTTFKRRAMVPPVSIADRKPLDAAHVLDAFVKSDVRLLTGSICPYCRGRVQHAVLPAAELEETIRTYDRDESDGAHSSSIARTVAPRSLSPSRSCRTTSTKRPCSSTITGGDCSHSRSGASSR